MAFKKKKKNLQMYFALVQVLRFGIESHLIIHVKEIDALNGGTLNLMT